MAAHQKGAVDKSAKPKPEETAPEPQVETEATEPQVKAKPVKVEVPKLDASKTYTVVGTGSNRHLHKGTEHEMSGADAMLVIGNGGATLKDK